MKRILFVDDDIPVLDGLRARLRRMESQWAMTFVDSGAQALAELEREAYDVVVSDIRMPGMAGARLLRTVSERWPAVVRIALSGYADPQQTLHLAPIVHQFLSKPCESPLLEDAIERCLELQELLREPALRAIVGRIRRLPALRRTYTMLQSAMLREDVTAREVAQIVASDTVVAAKVLQMVNSAFFRRGRRITNMDQAVNYLGFRAVGSLVLSAEVFAQWPEKPASPILDLEQVQQHAQATTGVALTLTARTAIADDALLAALLHDIGYWVLAHECPRELEAAHAWAIQHNVPMHEAERQTIGASHAEIGAYLLGLWGLPPSVIEAVAYHHAPERVRQTEFDVLAAVAIAHALAGIDDAAAFRGAVPPDAHVGPQYLETVRAPMSWNEATEHAAVSLKSGGAIE
jgi:putative nucleotidyltransferase with HDIG domain